MISHIKSPMGYFYKYDKGATSAEKLTRRVSETGRFGVGQPDFSIQQMTPGELEHIARLMRAEETK